jgi:hypothetical protein
MIIRKPSGIRSSEITPPHLYFDRRRLLMGAMGVAAAGALPSEARPAALTAAESAFSTDEGRRA